MADNSLGNELTRNKPNNSNKQENPNDQVKQSEDKTLLTEDKAKEKLAIEVI